MNELEQVDRFFAGDMSAEEKQAFEQELARNTGLASAAAFYLQTREAARREILAEKRKQWERPEENIPSRRTLSIYVASAAAVIALLLGIGWWVLRPAVPERSELASAYIADHLATLQTRMGGTPDTLQLGIGQYNEGHYEEAKKLFQQWLVHHAADSEALKLAGITSLKLGDYDDAIRLFRRLGNQPGLYANPGPFYEAIARLRRHRPEDETEAEKLLKRVVAEELPGKAEAARWLGQ